MMSLFEWYGGLPPLTRFLVSLGFLLLGLVLLFVGGFSFRSLRLATLPLAIGLVLLCFSFPSDSERKGYHD